MVKGGVWKDRIEAEEALKKYLTDLPSEAYVFGDCTII